MNAVLDKLFGNLNSQEIARMNEQDIQRLSGTLVNVQGLIDGQSLNANGNRAYVGLGGSINRHGNVVYSRVVNAWLEGYTGDTEVGSPVTVRYSRSEKRYYIYSMDAVRLHQSGSSIQRHNASNVNNRFMDAGYILDFLSRPVITDTVTTVVEVKPGILYVGQQRYEYDGGKIDLASYAPATGEHKIVQLWYDPASNAIKVTSSTAQAEYTPFDSTDWKETLVGTGDWLPLQSYRMFDNSDTLITHRNLLRDNRPIYTLPSNGGGGQIITSTYTIPDGHHAYFIAPVSITGEITVNGEMIIL